MGGNLNIQPAYRDFGFRVSGELINTNLLTNNAFYRIPSIFR